MIKRNEGFTEKEKLQNRFTAFITTSMSRASIDYLRKEKSRSRHTVEMEDEKWHLFPMAPILHQDFVIPMHWHTELYVLSRQNDVILSAFQ